MLIGMAGHDPYSPSTIMAESEAITPDQIETARRKWKEAQSFHELCSLTAAFIDGQLPYMPEWGGSSVDAETSPLVPYLAALNRAGFLTTTSQPGEDFPKWKQRAFVDGFALEPVARRIARLSLYSDLHIVVSPPGFEVGFHTPVILRDFQPHGWAGFCRGTPDDEFGEDCSPAARIALQKAWCVSVVDLAWGREEHLWKELTRELCYSEQPHPDLGLETNFAI